jgi:hypothetical protein
MVVRVLNMDMRRYLIPHAQLALMTLLAIGALLLGLAQH